MVMIPHIYVTSALSSHHSAKICHTPVFDYRSGIETAGGKFKKKCRFSAQLFPGPSLRYNRR
jgi:hypothetical protein